MEQQHYEGLTDDGQFTGRVTQPNNNREVKEYSEQGVVPGGDYSRWSSAVVTGAMGCEDGEDAD